MYVDMNFLQRGHAQLVELHRRRSAVQQACALTSASIRPIPASSTSAATTVPAVAARRAAAATKAGSAAVGGRVAVAVRAVPAAIAHGGRTGAVPAAVTVSVL